MTKNMENSIIILKIFEQRNNKINNIFDSSFDEILIKYYMLSYNETDENNLNTFKDLYSIIDGNEKKTNQFEEELKNEIQFLEEKLKTNEESHSNNLQILNNHVNRQLNAIKDRENYIVKQSEQITDGLKKVAHQKQNAVDVLKIENQQLKDRNYIINTKL